MNKTFFEEYKPGKDYAIKVKPFESCLSYNYFSKQDLDGSGYEIYGIFGKVPSMRFISPEGQIFIVRYDEDAIMTLQKKVGWFTLDCRIKDSIDGEFISEIYIVGYNRPVKGAFNGMLITNFV